MKHIAIIGYGAIAREVLRQLRDNENTRICGVICRPGKLAAVREALDDQLPVARSVDELSQSPDLVLECAGHSGLREHGGGILSAGIDLVTVSAGALADSDLHDALTRAAKDGHARLQVISGAIGGLDVLSAAKHGKLTRVLYRGSKPPASWRGTPAETAFDLDALTKPQVHYRGNARDAARFYPKNANVAASVALAGIGFENTQVELVADPTCTSNRHEIEAEGDFGRFSMRLAGNSLADNPKSSALTAMSMVRAVVGRDAPILVI